MKDNKDVGNKAATGMALGMAIGMSIGTAIGAGEITVTMVNVRIE